jgi:hypothetical protein
MTARKIEILAEIARRLFLDRLSAAVAALVRDARIVTGAIQADAEVRIAPVTGLTPARQARQCPFPSAFVTVTGFSHAMKL